MALLRDKFHYLAKLEGQGLGTAYEYLAKYRHLRRVLAHLPKTALIYGLPEKYGFSLDLFWFCQQHGIKAHVWDDRLRKLSRLLDLVRRAGLEKPIVLRRPSPAFDVILSCEAMQRHGFAEYMGLLEKAPAFLVFAPNIANRSHAGLTGLLGYSPQDFAGYRTGYVDIPPFPPGLRARGRVPAGLLLWALSKWAEIERFIPFKRRLAHILYVQKLPNAPGR